MIYLLQDIRGTHRRRLAREPGDIQRAVEQLYEYWLAFWIGRIGPERFTCHGRPNRTNNLVEAWHRWFNKQCVHAHLNHWDFIGKVLFYI